LEKDADTQSDVDLQSDDHVLSYACDLITLGLLYMEFSDAIREREIGNASCDAGSFYSLC